MALSPTKRGSRLYGIVSNVETAEVVHRWSGHRGQTQALAFSRDGTRLYSADTGGLIRCRNVEDGKILYNRAVRHGVTGIDLSADESRLLLQGTIDVRLLDLPAMDEQSLTTLHGHEAPISGLLFLADEEQAVSSSWDHTIRIWKLPPRK